MKILFVFFLLGGCGLIDDAKKANELNNLKEECLKKQGNEKADCNCKATQKGFELKPDAETAFCENMANEQKKSPGFCAGKIATKDQTPKCWELVKNCQLCK